MSGVTEFKEIAIAHSSLSNGRNSLSHDIIAFTFQEDFIFSLALESFSVQQLCRLLRDLPLHLFGCIFLFD